MATTKVRYNQIKTGLPAGGDLNYSDVSLLLNMEGNNGSTTFTDGSSSGHSITANGNASISTSEFKFGGSSAYFDGSSHLSCNSSDFAFGTGDFTIEWRQKVSSQDLLFTDQHGVIQISASSGGLASSPYTNGMRIAFGVVGNGSIGVKMGNTDVTSSTGVLTANTWQHLSVVRNSNTVKIFLNGSEIASGTNSENITSQNLAIGGYIDSRFLMNGYVDELRITKGLARYTSNFSVPTAAFPAFESKEGKELRVGANGTIELES